MCDLNLNSFVKGCLLIDLSYGCELRYFIKMRNKEILILNFLVVIYVDNVIVFKDGFVFWISDGILGI